MEEPRIGVYICECGVNIAATVDVPAVVEMAAQLPGVVIARQHKYTGSEPGQLLIELLTQERQYYSVDVIRGQEITQRKFYRSAEEEHADHRMP